MPLKYKKLARTRALFENNRVIFTVQNIRYSTQSELKAIKIETERLFELHAALD